MQMYTKVSNCGNQCLLHLRENKHPEILTLQAHFSIRQFNTLLTIINSNNNMKNNNKMEKWAVLEASKHHENVCILCL